MGQSKIVAGFHGPGPLYRCLILVRLKLSNRRGASLSMLVLILHGVHNLYGGSPMKSLKRILAASGLFLSALPAALAVPCGPTIADAVAYLNTPDPGYQRSVGYTLAANKGPAKWVGSLAGHLAVVGTSLRSQSKMLFSDRGWCPEAPAGSSCLLPYQPFSYKAPDNWRVTLSQPSNLQVVLMSWGNATVNVPLACQDGFIYGVMTEGNGKSFLSMTLRKYRVQIPQ